jgi:hypothetical protein
MIGLGLRQVQETLNRKADEVQHEFVNISNSLEDIGRQLVDVRGGDTAALRAEQQALRDRQAQIAEEVNLWRERARQVTQQHGQTSLRAYLEELATLPEPQIQASAKHALYLLDAPEEELARLGEAQGAVKVTTAAGRLLTRARSPYDLGGSDPAQRRKAAIEYANRPGVGQDEDALAEIEAATHDADPPVAELATLTAMQIHRFRAMRLAQLDAAHASVKRLAAMDHPDVVRILVEILDHPRTGYEGEGEAAVEKDNGASRMTALLRLVKWHTEEARQALRARQFDQDPAIVQAAARALELFPGDWKGPLKTPGTGDPGRAD